MSCIKVEASWECRDCNPVLRPSILVFLPGTSIITPVLVSEFDFHLPDDLIAQQPLPARAASRMLCLERHSGNLRDSMFKELPALLRPGDLLVMNDTRVFPARLYGHRSGERAQEVSAKNPAAREFLQGRIEVLLTKQLSHDLREWEALARPGRKIGVGERLYFGGAATEADHLLAAEVIARCQFGERTLR